jgi:ceramide glucosyltransferase
MSFFFYPLALLLVLLSYKSFRGGQSYLHYFQTEISKPPSDYTPRVSVIVPCRGLDGGLGENLAALLTQDFPAYEVLFVADDETDPCVAVILNVIDQAGEVLPERHEDTGIYAAGWKTNVGARLIIAGRAAEESQKVHNLRVAVPQTDPTSEIFVFVDSDARPGIQWLRSLTAPLNDEKIGAATGYRWFIPAHGNFASEMLSVWNASIASALGANLKSNFCWGGSMAVRRDTFEHLNIAEKWRGTLSDDFTVTRAMNSANLPIYFVPRAVVASVTDCGMKSLFEFTTRQMKITRVYAPHLWKQSLIGAALFNLVFGAGLLMLVLNSPFSLNFIFTLAALFLITVFSTAKARLRLSAVRLVINGHDMRLQRQVFWQSVLWPLSPAIFLYNAVCAMFSRTIVWRGIKYELKSPAETVIISN